MVLYVAIAQEGSDLTPVTTRGRGAGEEGRTIPSNAAATRQQQALGDALYPEMVGQRHSPLAYRVSPRGGCKQSLKVVDGPSAAGRTALSVLQHRVVRSAAFSLGIINSCLPVCLVLR